MSLRKGILLSVAGIAMTGSTGCGVLPVFRPDPRTSDGGGGNVFSASTKAVTGQLTELTQDELQILADQVNAAVKLVNRNFNVQPLTNAQADAVLEFLNVNSLPGDGAKGLNTLDEVRLFAEAALADPSIVVVPQSVLDEFDGQFSFIDLSELDLGQIFGTAVGNMGQGG